MPRGCLGVGWTPVTAGPSQLPPGRAARKDANTEKAELSGWIWRARIQLSLKTVT